MSLSSADATDLASTGETAQDVWLPWTFRRILALPGPPLVIGAGAVLLSLALDAVWFNAAGSWQGYHFEGIPIWLHPYASVNLAYAVTLGLAAITFLHLFRGADRDLSQLLPELELAPASLANLRREILSVPARSLRIGTAIALLVAMMDLWIGFAYADLARFSTTAIAWTAIREVSYDILVFRVFTWGIIVALRLSRLARETVRIHLFELSTLRPFTQNGVRLALFWLLLWAVWVPVVFVGPFDGGTVMGLMSLLGTGCALSAVAIALPTLGARRCLREAKATELAAVRNAIKRDRGAAFDPNHPDRNAATARLSSLLAYEARVEGIPESLLDAQSVRRLGLYLLIPLASWVGGAMIERLVNAALD